MLQKIYPIMFVTLVVLISVTLLVFTESFTSAELEARQQQQVVDQLGNIFPEIDDFDYSEESEIYTLYAGGGTIGYAFLAVGAGYTGDIAILIGLEDSETVKGILIISQQETPGIGDRITGDDFLSQFVGLGINAVDFKQNGGQIDGITMATISSKAVISAVRETAIEKVKQIEGVE
ncbi:MAG: FMN-binding protein [Chloroflexota bacterium]